MTRSPTSCGAAGGRRDPAGRAHPPHGPPALAHHRGAAAVGARTAGDPRRRRGTALLALVLLTLVAAPAATAAALASRQPTEYAAVVELIHQPEDNSTVEGVDREMATHSVLLQRRPLVQEVAADAGRPADELSDDLSVEAVDGSSVLRVQLVDTDPERARETLDDLVDRYLASADRLAVTSDIGRLRVLAPSDVLDEPVGPDPVRAGAAGLLLGIFLAGLLLALLRLRRGRGRTT
ncbi:hypothetical protein [Blastococcus sp. PRF04-17]|uniref:hypothetical protein n=1 Tax=Blastococcus sp. PRF04-17 TaxID=2933797 RepID=UPI001FF65642|nr:hypothetical protein [Blastococcus sp. PRF04-17]UOY00207.1 hypothetical protein MVA48_14475 [Blastococcus sp. PRF04-17]